MDMYPNRTKHTNQGKTKIVKQISNLANGSLRDWLLQIHYGKLISNKSAASTKTALSDKSLSLNAKISKASPLK